MTAPASAGKALAHAPVVVLGAAFQSGVYLLRIALDAACTLPMGRFRGGAPLYFSAGEYIYVGSALAARGSTSLACRLLRHATRSGNGPPQRIRARMIKEFAVHELGGGALKPPRSKKCFWHVDYLLDQPGASLTQVFALRTQRPLERPLAQRLAADPVTRTVAAGLGASDDPGATHLYSISASDSWWNAFTGELVEMLRGEEPSR